MLLCVGCPLEPMHNITERKRRKSTLSYLFSTLFKESLAFDPGGWPLRPRGSVAVWPRGSVAVWPCGSVGVWECGSVATGQRGRVGVWECGRWQRGRVRAWQPSGRTHLGRVGLWGNAANTSNRLVSPSPIPNPSLPPRVVAWFC